MPQEYVIYCDESVGKGRFFSSFYGGVLIRKEDFNLVNDALIAKKQDLGLERELKWSRVSEQYLGKYIEFIGCFFDFVEQDKVKVRIMFTQNRYIPIGLSSDHAKNSYFMLYYQFLKHAFGLTYSNSSGEPIAIQLNLDQIPDTKEKTATFKNYLLGLNRSPGFKSAQIHLSADRISEIDSSKHTIAQGLDIILGAMAFRLNDGHKEKPVGQNRRGKRTIAKEKLYKLINSRIRAIYPGFNIGVSTGTPGGIEDRWQQSYRHWLFIPADYEVDPTKKK